MLESDTGSTVVHKHGRAIIETSFCREKHVHLWAVQGVLGAELRVQSNDPRCVFLRTGGGAPLVQGLLSSSRFVRSGGCLRYCGHVWGIPYASLTCRGYF